ncbi:cupin domain-containing protein [Salmonella enterica]|uniref:Cupin domain-containing protein n=4 Tax=Salmonella enterica TaxID=28901 RepID=A0A3J4LEC9_SALER|nr:cupin domain-containing protein [Salmonella enterica]EBV8288606.1 cupin domain-containing protein [Salmonella enterica subsp. arizonae serovar 18:z4,z23:-]EBV9431914.1 cupin domain-containing protein [Salmonella enterica subsp. enterica serovar Heidelberg]ECC3302776.1 cupin domain-containing protein [Salmonella enterica subsp. arizonae]ECE0068240.1 cupin domain-containing protein [Salmonella enterica subsp. enterica]ECU7348975.1 cupin domain-containing protein [Salmonella enterica subsp. en
MHAFKLNQPVPELQPVGSVSLLGASPTEGDPQVAVAMIYGKPEDVFTCGLFSSTRGGFTMVYPFTEHATVLEGEVELTVAGQEPIRFSPGDSWFVEQGTEVAWKVLTPRFVKHYLAKVESNKLG